MKKKQLGRQEPSAKDAKHLLRDYKNRHNLGQNELARLFGVSTGVMSNWISGRFKPNHDNLLRIQQLTK